jgi:uncharacterized protein (TIGR03435 family)
MTLLATAPIALAVASLFTPVPQTPDTFEVAAIHQNISGAANTRIDLEKGGRLVIVNASLQTLIRNAYGVLPFQLSNLTGWPDETRFDINAKNASGEDITQDSLKPLLQNLLVDRFHLKAHWETREMPIYSLVTEKDGPKFKAHADAPDHGMNTSKQQGLVRMRGTDVPMSELAGNLANQLGRFVTDDTNLQGHYDFVLHWEPDPTAESNEPSLFTALREQLGLRLESRKGPVKILVIDKAEKPADN